MEHPKTARPPKGLPRYFAAVRRPRPRAQVSLYHFLVFTAVVVMLFVDMHRQTAFLVPLYPFVISMHAPLREEPQMLHVGAMAVIAGTTAVALCGLLVVESAYLRYKFHKRADAVERNHFTCFTVCASRDISQQWGLNIGARTKMGYTVIKVNAATAFGKYNADMLAHGKHAYAILPDDVIVAANGQALRDVDHAAMTDIFRNATENIRIAILRANRDFILPTTCAHWKAHQQWEYAVTLRKKTPLMPLGIRLTGNAADGMSMRIDVIQDGGFIQKLNARGLGVEVGDKIVAANGVCNDLPKLVRTMAEEKDLDLTIRASRVKCDKVEIACPTNFTLRCLAESGKLEVSGIGPGALSDGDMISSVNGSTCPCRMAFLLATQRNVIAYIGRKEVLNVPQSNGMSDNGQLIERFERHCADMESNLARIRARAKMNGERIHKVERRIRAHQHSSGRCDELVETVEKLVAAVASVAKVTPSFVEYRPPATTPASALGAS